MNQVLHTRADASTPNVRGVALFGLENGFSVLPPKQDGSKAPLAPGGRWKAFQSRRPSYEELDAWYGTLEEPDLGRTGVGTVCGKVSGNLECLEFDRRGAAYEAYKAAAIALGLGDLVERIESGYLERSPSGGIHWLYRCATIAGSTPLAQYESEELDARGKPIVKPIIETKGEGGYIILAPSNGTVHPTGGCYELLRGSLERVATITPEEREAILNLARTFDEMPHVERPNRAEERERKRHTGGWNDSETITPWDDYNEKTTWPDVLPAGWTLAYERGETEYCTRPGKTPKEGVSATINRNGSDRLYVFSTAAGFTTRKPYRRSDAFAHLSHAGDFKEAAAALCRDGYGTHKRWWWDGADWVTKVYPNPCPKGERIATPKNKPTEPPTEEPKTAESKPSSDGTGKPDRESREPPISGPVDYGKITSPDLGIQPLRLVTDRPVKWLWKYRLERGGLGLMAGDAGIGKSQVLLSTGATVTVGGAFPDGSGNAPRGNVVILSAEDRPDQTIKPRLKAMGADLDRVFIVKAKCIIRRPGKPPEIDFPSFQNLAYWQEVFSRIPDVVLFIADPLPSYLGRGVNDSKNIEIRRVLEPFLHEVIEPRDICMWGNTHLNKSVDAKTPIHRITGSIAYGALPRNVHFVVRDPDDPNRRYFKQAKCNDAPDDLPAIAFRVERREVESDGGEMIETAIPVFDAETVTLNLYDVVNGSGKGSRRGPDPKKETALAEWLVDYLRSHPGWILRRDVFAAAGEAKLIGTYDAANKRWSNGTVLYRAKDRVPELPEPRAGLRIDEQDMKADRDRYPRICFRLFGDEERPPDPETDPDPVDWRPF